LTQFNRYNDKVLAAWKEIFAANPTAHLKVFSGASPQDHASMETIKSKLLDIGLSEERINIRPWLSYPEFLTELLDVDVALDPFPYPGGITTMDALWMGIPTVTLAGQSSYQRIGASLMTLAELPDLIATSIPAYIEQANTIAADPLRLAKIRASLRPTLEKTALVDAKEFSRAFTATLFSLTEK
jgi:predicted O-linked N-acetylglucosamine transferase (SPINDLY family)